jgi:hypothetical protein
VSVWTESWTCHSPDLAASATDGFGFVSKPNVGLDEEIAIAVHRNRVDQDVRAESSANRFGA